MFELNQVVTIHSTGSVLLDGQRATIVGEYGSSHKISNKSGSILLLDLGLGVKGYNKVISLTNSCIKDLEPASLGILALK